MFNTTLASVLTISLLQISSLTAILPEPQQVLASHTISLETRYPVKSVNEVFKDNILLTLNYLNGMPKTNKPNWNEIEKVATYSFTLQPNEVFAFHDSVLPEYQGKIIKTTNAHFSGNEGYKSDGYLMGDGVCHLASLLNWTAKDANLYTLAPTRHDFTVIPEISKEYGVSIYSFPNQPQLGVRQNLYITNNRTKPVKFEFKYDAHNLALSVTEEI